MLEPWNIAIWPGIKEMSHWFCAARFEVMLFRAGLMIVEAMRRVGRGEEQRAHLNIGDINGLFLFSQCLYVAYSRIAPSRQVVDRFVNALSGLNLYPNDRSFRFIRSCARSSLCSLFLVLMVPLYSWSSSCFLSFPSNRNRES